MKLWYNHNATFDWNDFIFLGSGTDSPDNPMPPNGPMLKGIKDSNHIWGNSIFTIEHVLEIRIDDIPPDQVEIRNMYTANVLFK